MFQRIINFIRNIINTVVSFFNPSVNWVSTIKSDSAASDGNDEIDNMIISFMKSKGIKAGQFSLREDGILKMSSAYTWAEPDYPVTMPDSVMRVASCSKVFTTAAVLNLMKDGQITGNELVFDLLREDFPDGTEPMDRRVKEITVKHLVEHTGGWDYRSSPIRSNSDWVFLLREIARQMGLHRPPTKSEFARFVLCKINLDFDPGTSHTVLFPPPDDPTMTLDTYSNIGYVLLGMVIEKVSGQSYIDYLNDKILTPLSIGDVKVGKTRISGRQEKEVFYDSPYFGPDATTDPSDISRVPFPYGGDGSMKELMDSSGGLIMSANSLSLFINKNNAQLKELITDGSETIESMMKRRGAQRQGAMPGTRAVASSFTSRDGKKDIDMGLIFNSRPESKESGNDDVSKLAGRLAVKVAEVF